MYSVQGLDTTKYILTTFHIDVKENIVGIRTITLINLHIELKVKIVRIVMKLTPGNYGQTDPNK